MAQRCTYCGRNFQDDPLQSFKDEVQRVLKVIDTVKDGETVCEHGRRPFECGICQAKRRV